MIKTYFMLKVRVRSKRHKLANEFFIASNNCLRATYSMNMALFKSGTNLAKLDDAVRLQFRTNLVIVK
jgi:hypothetical protein